MKINEQFYRELIDKIQPYFIKGGSHSFDHTERVLNLAVKMAKKEKADLDIVKTAVLLHDVARWKEEKKEIGCHAEHGAEIAENILKEMNFPEEKIKKVVHAIKVHRHSKGLKAETKEAEILQDADRLDALGAITVGRMFSTGGELNRPMHNPKIPFDDGSYEFYTSTMHGFHHRILKIKPETFHTSFAKKLAKNRYKFVEKFLDEFLKEWEGKK